MQFEPDSVTDATKVPEVVLIQLPEPTVCAEVIGKANEINSENKDMKVNLRENNI